MNGALPAYPGLSPAANVALAEGRENAAKLKAFRFTLKPGEEFKQDIIGNTAYIGECDGPCEIAVDALTDYAPWDAAMAFEMGENHYYKRIGVKNPDSATAVITGILYAGFVRINDRRNHSLGTQRVELVEETSAMTELSPLTLADTKWHTLASASKSRREIWISVEPITPGDETEYNAWWRVESSSGDEAPGRLIGLNFEGVTKLPITNAISVRTDTGGAGKCRIRCWTLSRKT